MLGHSAGKDGIELVAWLAGAYTLKTARGGIKTVNMDAVPGAQEIKGPWEVRFPEGWGAPTSKVLRKLISWSEDSEEGVRHFSGTATYHKEFDVPQDLLAGSVRLILDLGEVREVADVWLNDQPLGIVWKPPFRVDIGKAVRPGRNTLKIEITNLWRNRLIGDANLPQERRKTNTNVGIAKDAPLLKSGLIGPVRVIAGKSVMVQKLEGDL